MAKYKFTLHLEYDIEAETKQDAINEVADLIGQDYVEFVDGGDLELVET